VATTANRAYRYPQSTDDVRPYEDIQFLATDVDTDVQALYAAAWVAFNSPTLVWSANTTAPALGNGTLLGRYQLQGNKGIRFQGRLTIGTTSTFGTGFWIFNVPFSATADSILYCVGTHRMDDVSVQSRPGTCRFFTASQLVLDNSGGVVAGNSPVVPASTDAYTWDITYERV